MKFIDLAQSSPEWLDWRRTGITASDVSALFGTNPYKTEWKLWAEKTGLQMEDDLGGNPYVRRGKVFEQMLREHVVRHRSIGIMPVCVEHDTIPYLKASLDGICRNKRPWEFKIPSPDHYADVVKKAEKSEYFKQYWPQVQHQLLVTGASEGYLIFGDLDESTTPPRIADYKLFVIPADPSFHEQIRNRAAEFMDRVARRVEPAKDPNRDLFAPHDPADAQVWRDVAEVVNPMIELKQSLRKQIEELDKKIKESAAPAVAILGLNKFGEFAGLRITRVDRSQNIDYPALLEAKGLDPTDETLVGPYRKVASKSFKFTAL